jgi:hypothetical protein
LIAAAAVAALSAQNGAYFPTEWGLAALGFVLLGTSTLILGAAIRPGRLELAFITGLAGFALWTLLSASWSLGAAGAVLEAERTVLYVVAVGGMILLLRADAVGAVIAGLVAGTLLVACYSLATRLFPGHIGGSYDPSSGYQLAKPLGYWNALGLLTAMALVLALALAAHQKRVAARMAAAAALVPLASTLYFTFSRGALAALAAALVLLVALDPHRARLLGMSVVVVAPAALGVHLASGSPALTAAGATLQTAQREGSRLAVSFVLLAVIAAALAAAVHAVGRRVRLDDATVHILLVGVVAVVVVATGSFVLARGGPAAVADRVEDAFAEPVPSGPGHLNRRLLSLSGHGRAEYWRVAWNMTRENPVTGAGAGSFEAHWLRERPTPFHARDAHSLYLEAVAELGPAGLLLLVATLSIPLVALRGARTANPLAPAAGAAFIAYLLHAAVDWHWEVPAVTIPALLCAVVVLVSARPPTRTLSRRMQRTGYALAAAGVAVALVTHVGNGAIAASDAATLGGDPARGAAEARRAHRWAPWSHEPWQLLGEAQLALGDDAAARQSLYRAVELDPDGWKAWYDLALATSGRERAAALAEAQRLNPLSPELRDLVDEIGGSG